jgi:cytochrome b561
MIILGMPLFAWLGILLLLCLFTQGYLGYSISKGKPYFKAHKTLGITIILLAAVHATLALLFLLKGITI